MILELALVGVVAAVGYAVYKHVTVAQVKAELVKIENSVTVVSTEAAVKAKVLEIVAALRAKL